MRALAALALASTLGCSVSHQAIRAPLGDPSVPAMRTESLETAQGARAPGLQSFNNEWSRPVVTREGLKHEDASDDLSPAVLIGVRVGGPANEGTLEVVDMMWSPPSAPRCQGGHPAIDILLPHDGESNTTLAASDQIHWERPVLVRGETVLSGRFDEDPPLLYQASVVDVRLVERTGAAARETCVRVPVTGPDVTYWNTRRWSFGFRLDWQRSLAFSRGSALRGGFSVGRWVGPVRLGVEGVFGGSPQAKVGDEPVGTTSLCFLVAGPDCDSATFGGGAVEASGLAWRWSRWALGWSASYEALFASVDHPATASAPASASFASSGGPRLGVQLLRVSPPVMGTARISPTAALGFEAFVGYGDVWRGAASGRPLTFGVGVLFF